MAANEPADSRWSDDDLEQAYQQALRIVEAAEVEVDRAEAGSAEHEAEPVSPRQGIDAEAGPAGSAAPHRTGLSESGSMKGSGPSRGSRPNVTPRQIIEAALFVGGAPLTTKKLCWLLRDEFDREFVEKVIDELNAQYQSEGRPYEIVLGQGGYRMVLGPDFQKVRDRAFGLGPKEIKLSQEALEVLALVAYRQPMTRGAIEAAGKTNPGGTLRQLLRRELIAIERQGDDRKTVAYRTTPRFLEVFGLRSLDELPQSEDDLEFK